MSRFLGLPALKTSAHVLASAALLLSMSCAGDVTGPRITTGSALALSSNLPVLDDLRDGHYVIWLLDAAGQAHLAATFGGGASLHVTSTIDSPLAVEVTIEHGTPQTPSSQVLLRGSLVNGRAELT